MTLQWVVAIMLFVPLFGGLLRDALRSNHRCKVDPDLSAYIGAPACPCGQYIFDEPVATQRGSITERYRRRCDEEDGL